MSYTLRERAIYSGCVAVGFVMEKSERAKRRLKERRPKDLMDLALLGVLAINAVAKKR